MADAGPSATGGEQGFPHNAPANNRAVVAFGSMQLWGALEAVAETPAFENQAPTALAYSGRPFLGASPQAGFAFGIQAIGHGLSYDSPEARSETSAFSGSSPTALAFSGQPSPQFLGTSPPAGFASGVQAIGHGLSFDSPRAPTNLTFLDDTTRILPSAVPCAISVSGVSIPPGGAIYITHYSMRAEADPGPGFVNWQVTGSADFLGTFAPGSILSGTAVVVRESFELVP